MVGVTDLQIIHFDLANPVVPQRYWLDMGDLDLRETSTYERHRPRETSTYTHTHARTRNILVRAKCLPCPHGEIVELNP